MKLLIDQNISYRLLRKLKTFPAEIQHVREVELLDTSDHTIFMYCRKNQFDAIVTMDDDFVKLLNLHSPPPKVIWIRAGNCSTEYLTELILNRSSTITAFIENSDFTLYELF